MGLIKFSFLILLILLPLRGFCGTFFTESFEDANFSSRGWYEAGASAIVSGGQSGNCLELAWPSGSVYPNNVHTLRHAFTATETLYVKLYMKFDTNWEGSQVGYHPHLFYILSSLDGSESGLATNYLDTYIEPHSAVGSPYSTYLLLILQDALRINSTACSPSNSCNLVGVTENRAVAGCNGTLGDPGVSDCYNGPPWENERDWGIPASPFAKGVWNEIEVYFQMNSIVNGIGQADGVMMAWLNGANILNKTNISYRTGQDATKMWNQFIIGPYIGDGSPIAQTMWIDELTVGSDNPYSAGPAPSAPTNLVIQSQ